MVEKIKNTIGQQFERMVTFGKMIKFSHTVFALPFAIVAFVIILDEYRVRFTFQTFILIVVAFTGARSFAMAFNRYADRFIDAENPRTSGRELPAGRLTPQQVVWFGGVSLVAVLVSAWLLSPIALYLSPVALALVAGYSYTKRFTWLCHYWLGAAIGLAPLGVYIAMIQTLPVEAWLLFALLATYIAGFDILYSIQDYKFDKERGLHSVPVRFGVNGALVISMATHIISILLLFVIGKTLAMGVVYKVGALLIALLISGEHFVVGWGKRVRLENIPVAFFHFNSGVSIFFLLFVAGEVYFG